MCLSKVEKVYKGTSRMIRSGYVVFLEREDVVYVCPGYRKVSNNLFSKDGWLNEKMYRLGGSDILIGPDNVSYQSGWHVFEDEEEAMRHLLWFCSYAKGPATIYLRKVQCKGLLAVGKEDNANVSVYRYIKIESGYGYFTLQ